MMKVIEYSLWPVLFAACCAITAYGFAVDAPLLYFNLAYGLLIISLFFLERAMPFERQWQAPDGQNFASLAHTFTSKGTVQAIVVFGALIGLEEMITPARHHGYGLVPDLWPREWPMAAQVILGLVLAEFGLYWAHRLAHEWPPIWRFHAVHHSVTKLWIVNTGRFHFVDSLLSIALGLTILWALGAPLEVLQWLSAVTAFIGMLTHCNVRMRFGPISWVFNTPELHRWHHSKNLEEGDKNYGENLMLWDLLFGTFYNAKRRPPADIGIKEVMPSKFLDQLIWPFLVRGKE